MMASNNLSGGDKKEVENKGVDEAFIDLSMISPFLTKRGLKLYGGKELAKMNANAMSKNSKEESKTCEKESNEESSVEVSKNANLNASDASLPPAETQILSEELPKWKTANCETIQNNEPGCSKSFTEENLPDDSESSPSKRRPIEISEQDREKKPKTTITETDVMRLAIDPGSFGITACIGERPNFPEGKCVFDFQEGNVEEVPKIADSPCTKVIGIIGCGPIAQEIINILIINEFTIKVWNRTLEKFASLPSSVEICKTPGDLIKKCDFVATCVSDEEAVLKIVFGKNGILEGLSRCTSTQKKGYIEMSSIKSFVTSKICEEITGKGGLFLDGQIQGTRLAVRHGSLVVVASGDRSLFEDARQFFATLASRVFYLGTTAGTASDASTIVSSIQAMALASLAETMNALSSSNIPTSNFTQLLNTTIEMPVFHAIAKKMETLADNPEATDQNENDGMITLGHLYKNLNNLLELGYVHSTPIAYASAAAEVYKETVKNFSKKHDVSVLRIADDA